MFFTTVIILCINCSIHMGQMTHYHSCQSLLLLNLNHFFFKCTACIYGCIIFSQFSFAWCCFCILGHFEWFSKSSLTHSTNTVVIFECICIVDKNIKQWLISPLWQVPVALSHIFSFTVYARAWWSASMHPAGLSIFFKCTSTSLFTGSEHFSWISYTTFFEIRRYQLPF